jgi:cytochrome c oxidase assembly factor CtaG
VARVQPGDPVRPLTEVRWGLALAIIGFFLPIILNQMLNSDYLHRLHKLLGFASAFVVFVVWITALKYRTRHRSSTSERG